MNNFIKKLTIFTIAMLCIISMNITAFASEVTTTPTDEISVDNCNLTFSLTDKTNGIFIDEITITLTNISNNLQYTYTMTSADYLFGITVGGNVQQGDYSIALDYASKEQFTIQNSDGTNISFFTANDNEYVFDWEVVSNEKKEQSENTTQSKTQKTTFESDTGNEEANALWSAFLDKVSVIETDSKYSQVLKIISDTADFDANYYEEATGNSKDEYLDMTPYEQFLWYSTYIVAVDAITASDYDTYCGSLAKWNSNAVGNVYNMLDMFGTHEMAEAYRELMEWDYEYFTEHGAVMNFITGKTSFDNENLDVLSSEDADGNNGEPTKEEIEELIEEENKDTDKGIWTNTINLIKDNAITITILLILVGVTICVIVYRKRKAIEDKDNQ